MFSTTTSAPAASRMNAAWPPDDFRLSRIARLLRCRFWKSGPSPFAADVLAGGFGRLDADHIGAPVGEMADAGGTGAGQCQIQHFQSAERQRRVLDDG